MDIMIVFLRTVLIYFVVFLVLRIMGKREVGKLSLFDLVISIMIAEIAVFVLEDSNKPLIEGLVPMGTLVLIQLLIAFLTLKSRWIRLLFEGKPSLLIEKGQLNRDEMKKQRYNLDDLLLQLRQQKVRDVADVELAILEPTGKLSVIEKGSNPFRFEGLPLPLILDGKVQDDQLEKLGQTRFWLKNQLQARGVFDFKEVFFCSIDHRGHIFLNRKR
ncbi:DUF421 domain-containing protein [Paenibacillus sp. GP183]|jgi:uncharacterized membrane protein YcaP (DUF421 family)|uniref:DUF421 domain-containing protein n=1 Tax=Paenibacillus sp. GP183 TaxID=1882751 RepID=UPI00089B8FD7|nr:DUF421 domain-containing protein [Paenibacillus sp. GP183]SEC73146.1 Uncharacterized membrane protein YcaP, DUF421 family [Paenibacillus sp. GP183]